MAALAGLFDVLFPDQLDQVGVPLGIVAIIGSVLWGLWRAWPRPISCYYDSLNTSVSVIEGDLFDETCHLVIGATTTFDVGSPIIAPHSVQGQALDRLHGDNIGRFEQELASALAPYTPIGHIDKPGKKDRYPIGTVAAIPSGARYAFYLAYTEMNDQNEAHGDAEGIWTSLVRLWAAVSAHGNGGTVAMPVIGGGQARVAHIMPRQDSIRLTALSFVFAARDGRVCDELRIVVDKGSYARLDRLELQAFLESLRPTTT